MIVEFQEIDDNGFYVFFVARDRSGRPEEKLTGVSEDGTCLAILTTGKRCTTPEQENGLCHVHNPNATYAEQNFPEGRRLRLVAPLVGDDSYLLLPQQESLF